MKNNEWYYSDWFIAFLFCFWFVFGIPLFIGIILLAEKNKIHKQEKSTQQATIDILRYEMKKLTDNQSEVNLVSIVNSIDKKEQELSKLEEDIVSKLNKLSNVTNLLSLTDSIDEKERELSKLEKEIGSKSKKLFSIANLYRSIEYTIDNFAKHELNIENCLLNAYRLKDMEVLSPSVMLKLHYMDMKSLRKAYRDNEKQINELLRQYSLKYTTKAHQTIYDLMVISLRAELQNILYNLKYEKLDKAIENIKAVTEKYLLITTDGNQTIAPTLIKFIGAIEYLFICAVKIEYTYYTKKEQAKQEQMAIREQMRQETAERKALEVERKKIDKEEEKYNLEISKLKEQMQKSADEEIEKIKLRISELQAQLSEVVIKKDEIINLQNGKAGNIYIISNLGSFGDNIFKIGMTRRLDPQDRVNELGSASVPFRFDVHSFIFSDDAVGLERKLHERLNGSRVNKVNLRKEFFYSTLDELENIINEIEPSAEFTKTMLAEQYRQSISTDFVYTDNLVYEDDFEDD